MEETSVTRSIYYYDLYELKKKDNEDSYIHSSKLIMKLLKDIYDKQKSADTYKDFLQPHSSGSDYFIIVDSYEDKIIKFRIVMCRKDALPFVEQDGKLEMLDQYLGANQNIAEITHCIYYPETKIMGAEYNASGARATSVGNYLRVFNSDECLITCRAKYNYEAYNKIIAGEELSLFDFEVRTNSAAYTNVLANKSIFQVFQNTYPESDTFEVVLRKKKTKKNKFAGFASPLDMAEIKDLLQLYKEDIKKFKISQGKSSEKIDLLSDKFMSKVSVVRTSQRIIDSNDIYAKIDAYYLSDVK